MPPRGGCASAPDGRFRRGLRAVEHAALRHSGSVPEGDIVWRTANRLNAALGGRVLTLSDLRWPSLATVDLSGREVVEVVSRGKHILARVAAGGADPPTTLHSHLR